MEEYHSCWVCGWHGEDGVFYDDPYCGPDPHCPCCNSEGMSVVRGAEEARLRANPLTVRQFAKGQTVYLVWGESCTKGVVESVEKNEFSIRWEGEKRSKTHRSDDPRLREKEVTFHDSYDYRDEPYDERCEWE